jgi:hypothetical protein
MQGKKSFNLYCDIIDVVEEMDNESAGELFKHVLRYVNDQDPEPRDMVIKVAFKPIERRLKQDLQQWLGICAKNKVNGSKGGRPKKNPTEPKETQKNPMGSTKTQPNPTKPDMDMDMDMDIKKKETKVSKRKTSFENSNVANLDDWSIIIPTKEGKYNDADFGHYHETISLWAKSKGATQMDWVAFVRGWMNREMNDGKYKGKKTWTPPKFKM